MADSDKLIGGVVYRFVEKLGGGGMDRA